MLSNAYFLAKFRFDTAENEPAKNLQNFRKMHFSKNAFFVARNRQPARSTAGAGGPAEPGKTSTASSGLMFANALSLVLKFEDHVECLLSRHNSFIGPIGVDTAAIRPAESCRPLRVITKIFLTLILTRLERKS